MQHFLYVLVGVSWSRDPAESDPLTY